VNTCTDCGRLVSEPLKRGRCRLCLQLDWRKSAHKGTPPSRRSPCSICGRERAYDSRTAQRDGYCASCRTAYSKGYSAKRKEEREAAAKFKDEQDFRGVDIDAVHRKRRAS
jgi:hypothetical protein